MLVDFQSILPAWDSWDLPPPKKKRGGEWPKSDTIGAIHSFKMGKSRKNGLLPVTTPPEAGFAFMSPIDEARLSCTQQIIWSADLSKCNLQLMSNQPLRTLEHQKIKRPRICWHRGCGVARLEAAVPVFFGGGLFSAIASEIQTNGFSHKFPWSGSLPPSACIWRMNNTTLVKQLLQFPNNLINATFPIPWWPTFSLKHNDFDNPLLVDCNNIFRLLIAVIPFRKGVSTQKSPLITVFQTPLNKRIPDGVRRACNLHYTTYANAMFIASWCIPPANILRTPSCSIMEFHQS